MHYESNKNKSIKKLIEKIANTISVINKTSSFETNYTSSRLFSSKVYQFKNLPEPKNATEGMIIYTYILQFCKYMYILYIYYY